MPKSRQGWVLVVLLLIVDFRGAVAMGAAPCKEKDGPLGLYPVKGTQVLKAKGVVQSIGRQNADGYSLVKLKGDDNQVASFLVIVERKMPRWMAKGSWLDVHIEMSQSGIHLDLGGTILDKEGRLLYGGSDNFYADWAPGWKVRAGDDPGVMDVERSRRISGLNFEYQGKTFAVPGDCALRVEIDGVSYLLQGSVTSYVRQGNKPIPPDSQAQSSFAVQRI